MKGLAVNRCNITIVSIVKFVVMYHIQQSKNIFISDSDKKI